MDTQQTLLEVSHLSVAFGDHRVVDDISYTLRRGATLGIVGESGSGKSISSLALMGLLPSQATVEGHAWLYDDDPFLRTDLLALSEQQQQSFRGRRISMVFQEPMTSLNPYQRCGSQVAEMMRAGVPHHIAGDNSDPIGEETAASGTQQHRSTVREKVIDLFREVLLPRPEKIFDSYPHELSGGQKQRVMIAMALINHPDIIIADEPTTALDVTVQKTILELLKSLQQRHGISVIFISHDLGVIGQVADDIMVMYRGRVVEQGPAATLLHHPQEPYTRGLLACRPPLDRRPHRLPTVEEFLEAESGKREVESDEWKVESGKREVVSEERRKIIEVRNLDVTYTLKKNLFGRPLQTLKGVDDVSLDIYEGETLGLVGESGCGKSTLGRAILSLIKPSGGTVLYRGIPLSSLSRRQMRALRPKLQIIFQDPYSSLNPRLTIGQAIEEPLRVHKVESGKWKVNSGKDDIVDEKLDLNTKQSDRERVLELMEQVGLSGDWYDRYPHELSGGQRQRVCIARALILRPELVICDESVSALDVSVQAQVLNLLNDLKERYHYTYLFITHDLSVVHYMADRIVVMQKGKLVESGTPDELFHNPRTAYTRSLIDAIPRII